VLGLVYLQHVVEAKYNFGAPAGDDLIPWAKEDDLFRRGRLQRGPCLRHAPCAQIAQQLRVASERVVHRLPTFNLDFNDLAISEQGISDLLMRFAVWQPA